MPKILYIGFKDTYSRSGRSKPSVSKLVVPCYVRLNCLYARTYSLFNPIIKIATKYKIVI